MGHQLCSNQTFFRRLPSILICSAALHLCFFAISTVHTNAQGFLDQSLCIRSGYWSWAIRDLVFCAWWTNFSRISLVGNSDSGIFHNWLCNVFCKGAFEAVSSGSSLCVHDWSSHHCTPYRCRHDISRIGFSGDRGALMGYRQYSESSRWLYQYAVLCGVGQCIFTSTPLSALLDFWRWLGADERLNNLCTHGSLDRRLLAILG